MTVWTLGNAGGGGGVRWDLHLGVKCVAKYTDREVCKLSQFLSTCTYDLDFYH